MLQGYKRRQEEGKRELWGREGDIKTMGSLVPLDQRKLGKRWAKVSKCLEGGRNGWKQTKTVQHWGLGSAYKNTRLVKGGGKDRTSRTGFFNARILISHVGEVGRKRRKNARTEAGCQKEKLGLCPSNLAKGNGKKGDIEEGLYVPAQSNQAVPWRAKKSRLGRGKKKKKTRLQQNSRALVIQSRVERKGVRWAEIQGEVREAVEPVGKYTVLPSRRFLTKPSRIGELWGRKEKSEKGGGMGGLATKAVFLVPPAISSQSRKKTY